MGASMRITTAYLNSSQVDAMQPRQPATQYEHKKTHFTPFFYNQMHLFMRYLSFGSRASTI